MRPMRLSDVQPVRLADASKPMRLSDVQRGPIGDIVDTVKPVVDAAGRVAKKSGNALLDTIKNLDRPAQALRVGVKHAYQGGNPFEGAKKGALLEEEASTQELLPEQFRKDNPITSGVAGFAGDVLTDPLTYGTLGIAPAAKLLAKTVGHIPFQNHPALTALNITTGDLKRAKLIQLKYDDLARSQTDDAVKGAKEYDKRLRDLALVTGMPIKELKARITAQAEKPIEDIKLKVGDPVADEAYQLRLKNARQSGKEQALGVRLDEVENYMPHVLTKEGRGAVSKQNVKDFFRRNNPQHASTKSRKMEGTVEEINATQPYGTKEFFTTDPAVSQGVRDARHAQSVNAASFMREVGETLGKNVDEAPPHFLEPKAPLLKGKKFEPEVAALIDKTHERITNPKELNKFLKVYDKAQNWWKITGLATRPAYHARNEMGNIWNNYLADVNNPLVYGEAARLQRQASKGKFSGKIAGHNSDELYQLAKDRGVVGSGQYHTDVAEELTNSVEGTVQGIRARDFVLPTTKHVVVRAGLATGRTLENNARLAHFIDRIKKGDTPDQAGLSVKKYLFDYNDLSDVEREVFKRVAPFYTWTRKNIPLQVEALVTKPGKINKINIANNQLQQHVTPPDERNAPDYVKKGMPLYVGENPDGTKQAALMMNTLPFADLSRLATPLNGVGDMVSPFIKEPLEQAMNRDTFMNRDIQEYDGQTADFLGAKMPVRLAKVMRNLIALNELDRANPGGVFGIKGKNRSYFLDKELNMPYTDSFGIGTDRESRNDLPGPQRMAQALAGIRTYKVDEKAGEKSSKITSYKELKELRSRLRSAKKKGNERSKEEIKEAMRLKKAERLKRLSGN